MRGDAIDLGELESLAGEGLISSIRHPSEPLLIHNYTARVQYDRLWTPTVAACRGLITDLLGNVVARPFPKFFNLAEHGQFGLPEVDWSRPFTCTKKLDGSLGVLYWTEGGYRIATRGSFTSPQAERANRLLEKLDAAAFVPNHTYLFEIIYPENRIVIDYRGKEALVLLEIIETETGRGLHFETVQEEADVIGCECVEFLPFATPEALQSLSAQERTNEEGVVVRFDGGLRIKIKYADYVRLHKLLTGVTAKTIWEYMRDGRDTADLIEHTPDEFHSWVSATMRDLDDAYRKCECNASEVFERVKAAGECTTRKDYAMQFTQCPEFAPILFKMLDGKAYDEIIWKMVKPEVSRPFVTAEE